MPVYRVFGASALIMNFRYMPELEWQLGYPFIIVVSIVVVVICLLIFRKKKWL